MKYVLAALLSLGFVHSGIAADAACFSFDGVKYCPSIAKVMPLPVGFPKPRCGVSAACQPIIGGNFITVVPLYEDWLKTATLPRIEFAGEDATKSTEEKRKILELFRGTMELERLTAEKNNRDKFYSDEIGIYQFNILTYKQAMDQLYHGN
jgi:hypothetical protein